MHIAFVQCRIAKGGALNVLKDIIETQTYTTGTIFTLYSEEKYIKINGEKIYIITALPKQINNIFLYFSQHKTKILSSILDYRNLMFFYIPLMKLLSRKIKKYQPKKIIISSFAIAKNISLPKNTPNILYLHSPMQYIRSHYEEYLNKLSGYKKILFKKIVPLLRKRDKKYTKFDSIISNSEYTAQLCQEIYHQPSKIAYPKIASPYLEITPPFKKQSYYVYTGRLVKLVKECDKIIQLFNTNKKPLLMIGNGPDEQYLKSLAKENIIFLDWIHDKQEMIKILKNARGMINITKESFGISTVEGLLCGTPVLGYANSASKELIDPESGILIEKKDPKSLQKAFEKFDTSSRDPAIIQEHIRTKLAHHPFKCE